MKTNSLFFVLIFSCIICSSCKEEPSAEELAQSAFLKRLEGDWTLRSAELDGSTVSGAFPGLIVTITRKGLMEVVGDVGNIWPSESSFDLLKDGDSYDLLRDDDLILDVVDLNDDQLVISMTFQTAPGGRMMSVPGAYTFVFER